MKWLPIFFLATALLVLQSCSREKSTEPAAQMPVVTTATVTGITQTTAGCGGTITLDGGATVTARGVCWSANPTPTVADNKTANGEGTGSFTSSITGLTSSTSYYVRAYATNSVGTGYGDILSFTTSYETGTVTDIDDNTYRTVKIGNQWWMAENLKVTHYRNGDAIPEVSDSATWIMLITGAYCSYNNDVTNTAIYGRLYNWYAVVDSHNIAPAGWHVPSDAEWQTLVVYLGGWDVAGGKMKDTGTTYWQSPNSSATNESGFTGLPGGGRFGTRGYTGMGTEGVFWSSAEYDRNWAWFRSLYYYNSGSVDRNYLSKSFGFSVRCIKD
jgi:uncharacterized protein (TIGR02145 family)